jgi:hypothetical protein
MTLKAELGAQKVEPQASEDCLQNLKPNDIKILGNTGAILFCFFYFFKMVWL